MALFLPSQIKFDLYGKGQIRSPQQSDLYVFIRGF